MHLSTTTYLCSLFSLLATHHTAQASPTPSSSQDITYSTTSIRACHHGTYDSFAICKINCGSRSSAGTCTKITTMLVNDSPPYDCTCPGDDTPALDNDQSHAQISTSSSSSSQTTPPPLLRKSHPRWLSAQNLQHQARAAQQQHQKWFVEKALEKPLAQQETPCKRGYHKNMDTCMANCGTKSGNCINFLHVDGGSAVACQCKPGEL